MSVLLKITDKVRRFDQPVGAPLAMLDTFHKTKPNDTNLEECANLSTEKTYEDGLREGRLARLVEIESQRADIITALQALQQAIQNISAQIEASHGRVITQILQAILPALSGDVIMGEIHNFILKLSAPALQGNVTLEAPEHLRDSIEAALFELASTTSDDAGAPAFTLGIRRENSGSQDCNQIRAKWEGGGGTIDIEGAAKKCLALLKHVENNYLGTENGKN